jgi:hypothetical protein
MKLYTSIYYLLFILILIVLLFCWINYLTKNNFIVECFDNNYGEKYSHTVDLPLTTTYSCKNFCGPTARCSITGQQCGADIDCYGCQPSYSSFKKTYTNVPGDNDAGKLTGGITPQYSPLTSGYGTHEKIITQNMFSKPLSPDLGPNTWMDSFKKEQKMFDERYKPPDVLNYEERYTLSGEFIDDGPYASNSEMPLK